MQTILKYALSGYCFFVVAFCGQDGCFEETRSSFDSLLAVPVDGNKKGDRPILVCSNRRLLLVNSKFPYEGCIGITLLRLRDIGFRLITMPVSTIGVDQSKIVEHSGPFL